jgi:hypothetical protein
LAKNYGQIVFIRVPEMTEYDDTDILIDTINEYILIGSEYVFVMFDKLNYPSVPKLMHRIQYISNNLYKTNATFVYLTKLDYNIDAYLTTYICAARKNKTKTSSNILITSIGGNNDISVDNNTDVPQEEVIAV